MQASAGAAAEASTSAKHIPLEEEDEDDDDQPEAGDGGDAAQASKATPGKAAAKRTRKRAAPGPRAGAGKRQKGEGVAERVEQELSFKGIFSKDLPHLMYGFGDSSQNPVPETVAALEDVAIEYVKEVLTKAVQHASVKQKVDHNDILFVIRKDARKSLRARELLRTSDRIKEAKKNLDAKDLTGLEQYAGGS